MRSESALQELMEESERLWNAGDQHGWEELWRAAVPGEHVLESPAGSKPKRGFEEARRQVWQQTQPVRITTKHLIISGSSVAALTENVVSIGDETFSIPSIDTYDFDDNGNCYERNYFALPAS